MDASNRVLLLLQLSIALVPVATYFLILGVIHTRAHASLISARADFIILTSVFAPALLLPLPRMLNQGLTGWLTVALAAVAGGLLFGRLAPRATGGWVAYNASPRQLRRAVDASLRRLGWSYDSDESRFRVGGIWVRYHIAADGLLRSTTLHLGAESQLPGADALAPLYDELAWRLRQDAALPTLTGSCLLLVGSIVLIVPLWMMSRHMDAIVELVQHFFVA